MNFKQIQSRVDFSQNTLQQHLEELLEKGIFERRKKPQRALVRPIFIYNIPEILKGRPLTAHTSPRTD